MTLKELNERQALWDAALIVWEDCGHQIARPIIALLERQEWAQATQMTDEFYNSFDEKTGKYQREALLALSRQINAAWDADNARDAIRQRERLCDDGVSGAEYDVDDVGV